jgi:hypothetical protein
LMITMPFTTKMMKMTKIMWILKKTKLPFTSRMKERKGFTKTGKIWTSLDTINALLATFMQHCKI